MNNTETSYETWLMGLNEKQNYTGYEALLHTSDEEDDEVNYAKRLDRNKLVSREDIPADVTDLVLVVECVAMDLDDCVAFNMKNVYEDFINVKKY